MRAAVPLALLLGPARAVELASGLAPLAVLTPPGAAAATAAIPTSAPRSPDGGPTAAAAPPAPAALLAVAGAAAAPARALQASGAGGPAGGAPAAAAAAAPEARVGDAGPAVGGPPVPAAGTEWLGSLHLQGLAGTRSWLVHLLTGLTYAAVVKAMCLAGNILVQLSPYSEVKLWERRRATGEADAAPYLSIAFGGWQWCYYGFFAWHLTGQAGFLILVHSNCLGALLGTYYIATFYRHCWNQRSQQSLLRYLSAVAVLCFLQACALLALPAERALFLTGFVSSFCSFIGACSMLTSLPQVFRDRDSRVIPGALVLANFLSSLAWCVCGWILSDPLISTPNVMCAGVSASCLYLKYRFPSAAGDASLAGLALAEVAEWDAAKTGAPPKELSSLKATFDEAPCYDGTGGT